jgi:O-antigen/teichoic acid export membrane protein
VLVADNLELYDLHAAKVVRSGIRPELLGSGLRIGCVDYAARCKTNQDDAIDFGLLKPLIRASHVRTHQVHYDEQCRYGEDFRFYLDMLVAGGSLLIVPEAYYRYTERIGSVSGKESGLSKTRARYDVLEAQATALSEDPRYSLVSDHLRERARAIRRLSKIAKFGQQSRAEKLVKLPITLTDQDMRFYIRSRVLARIAKVQASGSYGSTLLKDATNLCLGQGIKLVLQAIYFLCIARSLGPAQYGAFVAVTAMTSIICPYVGLGCGSLFLKNVRAGKRTAPVCWGNGLLATAVTGLLTTLVLCAISHLWLPAFPVFLATAICLSDLITMRVIDLASFGFAASGRMSKTAVQNTTMSLLRVIGIVLLSARYSHVTIQQWTYVYLITGIIGAGFALQQGTSLWGLPQFSLAALWEDTREGCFFSISTSAQTIYNDIDKTMLARLSTYSATGVYAAAYRIIDTSLTPVRSLVSAAYPQFFRIGTDGIEATYSYAKNLIRKAVVFGIADCLGLIVIAPILPHLLGSKYAGVAPAVQLLALIPVMRCVHWFLADALSGAGAQGVRTAVQVGVAILNVILNLAVLPRWSWVGAAWTSLASDAALAVAIYAAIQWRLSSQNLNGGLFGEHAESR